MGASFASPPIEFDQLVSWCFEPSQPRRITSGLIDDDGDDDDDDDDGELSKSRSLPTETIDESIKSSTAESHE